MATSLRVGYCKIRLTSKCGITFDRLNAKFCDLFLAERQDSLPSAWQTNEQQTTERATIQDETTPVVLLNLEFVKMRKLNNLTMCLLLSKVYYSGELCKVQFCSFCDLCTDLKDGKQHEQLYSLYLVAIGRLFSRVIGVLKCNFLCWNTMV